MTPVYWTAVDIGPSNSSYPKRAEMNEACASDPVQGNKEKLLIN